MRLQAGILMGTAAGKGEPAGPLLGLPASPLRPAPVDVGALRRRRPHWFTPDP